jgi:DNA-binding transcriptional MerR regulator
LVIVNKEIFCRHLPSFVAFSNQWGERATSSQLEVKSMRPLDISEVAKRSALPASTLRFYEEKGLIESIGRRGLKRLFEPVVLERLALISIGRSAGFSLDEIRRMFTADGKVQVDRDLLAAKATRLDITIKRLATLRDGLRHAALCPAPSHMECPTFRAIVKRAIDRPSRRSRSKRVSGQP